jgi:hypothetical protein
LKAKLSPSAGKPLAIKSGNVTVKIYAEKNRVNGTNYQQFTLAYYDGAKRIKKRFSDLEQAKREGELAADKLAHGEGQVLRLTSLDRANYRTEPIMQAELAKRVDGAESLTERELKTIIQRLHRNKFFARRTVFRRFTYDSIRLDNEALGKRIVERHTYPKFHRESQTAQDQAITDEIKKRRRNLP